jgi:hypothetical protein
MYKRIEITKKLGIAINVFPKKSKLLKLTKPVYHTGIYKTTDSGNGFDSYFFVLYRFRLIIYVYKTYNSTYGGNK